MGARVLTVLAVLVAAASARAGSFVNFESGHVRPLALSPVGDRLFAVNTPDNRLAIYTLGAGGLTPAAEVPVGLEPVAVAPRTNLDGGAVFAAVLDSGNRTTTITEQVVAANGGLPPPPPGSTPGAPSTGLIVQFDPATGHWEDEIGRNWSPSVAFSLPDDDVFVLDADASPPVRTGIVSGVGTVLFNMAVRPTNGKLYVANTDARNEVRFEPMVRGHLAESRITVVSGTVATPHHLNPHIDYDVVPGPQAEIDRSLAFPMDMAFSSDGQTVFVVGFGSAKVGAFKADDLEAGVITEAQIPVGQGPSGIVLDAARDRLYVMNRIDGTISMVANASNPATRAVTATVPLRFDPSPPAARTGRVFLYDARPSAHEIGRAHV